MSLKQEIETWVEALDYYDNNEFDKALQTFDKIADTSKILFNMGVINATLGQHEEAVECYQRAIKLDQYLAVAYFQQGVSNFLLNDFEEALANFNDTLLYLRGNALIDYSQLGLLFKLYSCEVLFNRGLCYIYLQQMENGMQDLQYAVKEKVVEDHNVIDDAIRDEAKGYTVFSIPVGVVYRPNEAKVRNLKQKDYLGKARLVAASDRNNAFTGFAGAELNKAITAPIENRDDRPTEAISFAASNLVKPGLQSRRQQSEPPNNRNVFPPTPPPENDKPGQMSRGQSVRSGVAGTRPVPSRLNLDKVRSNERYERTSPDDGGRSRPSRSASAAPSAAPSRGFSQRGDAPSRNRRRDDDDDYPDDVYDMYGGGGGSRNSRSQRSVGGASRSTRDRYIEEEDDEGSDYDDASFDEGEFEMVTNNSRRGPGSVSGRSNRGSTRRDMLKTVRIKVHAAGDVRYVAVGPAIEFPDLVDRIQDKFGLRRKFKIKIKDEDSPEGEMITMGDQDDLDMVMMSVKQNARKMRSDTGKMEIWVQEL
ncbi:hypothetical protein VTJ49DRAFT_1252 [Mycothermus thermophilus]|uniref:PB1 domain-containing protein n=1 Tax=Humicola insolens TaxID=85995 RepID=A0ABR3VDU6_HUMIN